MIRLVLAALLTLLSVPSQAQCGPHPVPSQAAAVGYTCETFFDGPWSLSTIDINNTGGPGFKWYTDVRWPRAMGSTWINIGVTPAGDLSISGTNLVFAPQGLTIPTPNDHLHAGMIMSCGPTTTPPFYQGHAFTVGWYLEVVATWPNGTNHGAGPTLEGSWPNAFTWPVEFLTSGFISGTTTEVDNFEAPFGSNFHVWTNSGGVSTDTPTNCVPCSPSVSGIKYGVLLAPTGVFGGPSLKYYQNDVLIASSPLPSGFTSAIFNQVANERHCIVLCAAQVNPMTIQTVRVFGLPSSAGGVRGLRK